MVASLLCMYLDGRVCMCGGVFVCVCACREALRFLKF